MTCASVMRVDPHTARQDSTISAALDLLIENHLSIIPVVDAQGKFIGLFGLHCLLGLMMPRAATMNDGLDDLGFISESITHVKTRMTEFLPQHISEFLMKDPILVHPETSLDKALMLLYKHGNDLPVVNNTGLLVGVISPWDVINKIKQG